MRRIGLAVVVALCPLSTRGILGYTDLCIPKTEWATTPLTAENASLLDHRVVSRSMWKKRSGAFFRLMKWTTNRPPWQAATGGTRHGEEYRGSCASAEA